MKKSVRNYFYAKGSGENWIQKHIQPTDWVSKVYYEGTDWMGHIMHNSDVYTYCVIFSNQQKSVVTTTINYTGRKNFGIYNTLLY